LVWQKTERRYCEYNNNTIVNNSGHSYDIDQV
jgi:hypothetical protein